MIKYGFRVASVLAVCLIVLLSIVPGNMQIRTVAPKAVEHLAAYLLTGLILVQAFGGYRRAPVVITFLVILAAALEVVQLWVPGRTFNFRDWEASSLGAMIGVLLACVWERTTTKNEPADGSLKSARRLHPQRADRIVEP